MKLLLTSAIHLHSSEDCFNCGSHIILFLDLVWDRTLVKAQFEANFTKMLV